jgi:mannose-1-phosphate guanylyltransferase
MTDPRFHACIIAGGSGERFWPMSRAKTPKHLLRLFSERTLLEETILRLEGVVAPENIWILTNGTQVPGIRAALPDFPAAQIVAEPAKRDTAPAAALATGLVRARRPDGVVAILAADHVIRDTVRFGTQLLEAFKWAAGEGTGSPGGLFTFAIPPTYPATGFGYLELGDPLAEGEDGSRLLQVRRFVEKPDLTTARSYLEGARHATFVRDFPPGDPAPYLAQRFAALPKISVDYAVLEKAATVSTVIADFDWDDVGLWTAMPAHMTPDGSGNVARGRVVTTGSSDTIAFSNGRLIALCGVRDLVVVETADAVLVCHKDAVQDIKKLLPELPAEYL